MQLVNWLHSWLGGAFLFSTYKAFVQAFLKKANGLNNLWPVHAGDKMLLSSACTQECSRSTIENH